MAATTDSVSDRIERARVEVTPAQLLVGIALVAATGFVLLFVQDPAVHDSLHNFRHTAGVTCH